MASIRRKVTINAPAVRVWDAMRDVGALDTRLVVGFVTDCKLEDGARIVTFANGMTAGERIIDVNDEDRRVAWAAQGGGLSHHNASAQVFPVAANSCEVVRVADQGLSAMKRTLESANAG